MDLKARPRPTSDHGRRRILHFNVTAHPTADWVMQQLRDAFPDTASHRYLIFDNDSIFSHELVRSVPALGICPRRTALRSPWQNGTAERFVGSVRRELLDHVVVLHDDHLGRLLGEYIEYYNTERVHTAISDAPEGRAVEHRPSDRAKVVGLPRVGGLITDTSGPRLPDGRLPLDCLCVGEFPDLRENTGNSAHAIVSAGAKTAIPTRYRACPRRFP
jgi:putative transposase